MAQRVRYPDHIEPLKLAAGTSVTSSITRPR